jgi:putative FmdB family regulatory protein
MPIYEFYCHACAKTFEEIRHLDQREPPQCAECGASTEYVISAPKLGIWNGERKFPNVSNYGDGSASFPDKASYERHLKDNHMAESSTDAPKKVPLGADVTVYDGV